MPNISACLLLSPIPDPICSYMAATYTYLLSILPPCVTPVLSVQLPGNKQMRTWNALCTGKLMLHQEIYVSVFSSSSRRYRRKASSSIRLKGSTVSRGAGVSAKRRGVENCLNRYTTVLSARACVNYVP